MQGEEIMTQLCLQSQFNANLKGSEGLGNTGVMKDEGLCPCVYRTYASESCSASSWNGLSQVTRVVCVPGAGVCGSQTLK